MSNLLKVIIDGITATETHWGLLLATLLILIVSQSLLYLALKRIFGNQFTGEEYYSLSIAGWLLPASILALLWYLFAVLFSPQIGLLITLSFIVGFSLLIFKPKVASYSSKPTILVLLLMTVFFSLLRMAFVSKAILPLYFDSAQHYLYIKNILANLTQRDAAGSFALYYHLGFHFLAAFITFMTHAQINDTMLVLGQVILATMPFSAFFIVRHWSRSNAAGIFAVVLAAFGWYMPAHAVDWGKYPALAGIALIPFVLSLACLSVQNRTILSTRKYWILNAIVLLGILVTVFLHSRTLIVFGIVALTWIITFLWQRMSKPPQFFILGISILALIAEIAFIQIKGLLGPLFDPYASKGLLITCVVLFLSILAYLTNPRLVFFCIVSIFFLLISLFVSLGNLIPGYANTTLLDRPFVETILYFPLALLAGFGLAGVAQKLPGTKIVGWNIQTDKLIGILFILLITVNAFLKYDLYPSACCAIVSPDDLDAIQWINNTLPQDARILISSTDLNVLPTSEYQGSAGGDAGTWITPLINRTTVFMPFNTDFSQGQTLEAICQLHVEYVYVGKTGSAFNDSVMNPEDYKILLSVPKAKVYQVTGCS